MKRRILGLVLTCWMALFAAACGSSQSSATPSSARPTILLPTMDPALVHAYPDLEAKLPASIAGRAMARSSYALDPAVEPDVVTLALQRAGKDGTMLEMAAEYPTDNAGDLMVLAYRYPGLTGADLLALLSADDVEGTITPTSLGGRQVVEITDAEGSGWAYASGDILYFVAGTPGVGEAAVVALP